MNTRNHKMATPTGVAILLLFQKNGLEPISCGAHAAPPARVRPSRTIILSKAKCKSVRSPAPYRVFITDLTVTDTRSSFSAISLAEMEFAIQIPCLSWRWTVTHPFLRPFARFCLSFEKFFDYFSRKLHICVQLYG